MTTSENPRSVAPAPTRSKAIGWRRKPAASTWHFHVFVGPKPKDVQTACGLREEIYEAEGLGLLMDPVTAIPRQLPSRGVLCERCANVLSVASVLPTDGSR